MMTDSNVDISGLDKVDVLRALWKNQVPAAFFSLNGLPTPPFDEDLAQKSVLRSIDYFCGRAIKTNLSDNVVDFTFYDRDAPIPAADVIKKLKK